MADTSSDGSLPEPLQRPAFLVGAERSGTTLLRLMLDHHPKVSWLSEFGFAVDPIGLGIRDREAYVEDVRNSALFICAELELREFLEPDACVIDFLRQFWEQERSPVVGATCHRHFDELLRLWPDARFVHIVRDPRDVARSRMKLGWSGHIWQAADPWLDAELLWEQFAPKLADDRKHELIFERLVSEPEAELTRLAAFLGVDYDPAMLSYPDDTTYEAVNAKLAGQWKGKMSDRDLQLIDQKLGSWLDRYGYERHEPGRDASTGPSKLKLFQFRVKDKVGVVGNEIKKYGWRPMLAKGVGRRLRIAPLHRWAHEQINARHRELIQ